MILAFYLGLSLEIVRKFEETSMHMHVPLSHYYYKSRAQHWFQNNIQEQIKFTIFADNGVGVLQIFVVDGDHCPYVMCLPTVFYVLIYMCLPAVFYMLIYMCLPTVKTIMSLRNWGVFSPPI